MSLRHSASKRLLKDCQTQVLNRLVQLLTHLAYKFVYRRLFHDSHFVKDVFSQ